MALAPDRRPGSAAPGAGTAPAGLGIPRGAHPGRGHGDRFGATERTDRWWLKPLAQAAGLVVLGGYATWAALIGNHYEHGHYLSPLYSPLIRPSWLPSWISPALLVLWAPGLFRATCYYYRRAYYRVFFLDPVACAVGEPRSAGYCGEAKFPFVLQNVHRFFFIVTLIFLPSLWWDVIKAFTFDGGFAVGLGSLTILVSTALITAYSLSCHSFRHLIGGRLDCFSCGAAGASRRRGWSLVSALNEHHMGLAWWSLLAVCWADFYVRMCSRGVFRDPVWTFHNLFEVNWNP